MTPVDALQLRIQYPLKTQNAGLFISRGGAMHPTRIINSHELIFVKQGEMDMWEEDRVFHVEAGQTLHLYPGRRHGSTKPLPLGLKFYWLHFEIEERADDSSVDDVSPAVKVPQISRLSQPERLERLFRMFLEDQETGTLTPYSANLLTMLMLVEVTQACQEHASATDDVNVVATWAHTYIRINFDRDITTSKVAEAIGYNADYLGRIYRQVYGCTLTEAIHRRRIDVACNFLLDTNLTIDQIADKCGFSDPDYFRRIFRRSLQMSPGQYREEFSRVHVNSH